eukprot:95771_1
MAWQLLKFISQTSITTVDTFQQQHTIRSISQNNQNDIQPISMEIDPQTVPSNFVININNISEESVQFEMKSQGDMARQDDLQTALDNSLTRSVDLKTNSFTGLDGNEYNLWILSVVVFYQRSKNKTAGACGPLQLVTNQWNLNSHTASETDNICLNILYEMNQTENVLDTKTISPHSAQKLLQHTAPLASYEDYIAPKLRIIQQTIVDEHQRTAAQSNPLNFLQEDQLKVFTKRNLYGGNEFVINNISYILNTLKQGEIHDAIHSVIGPCYESILQYNSSDGIILQTSTSEEMDVNAGNHYIWNRIYADLNFNRNIVVLNIDYLTDPTLPVCGRKDTVTKIVDCICS